MMTGAAIYDPTMVNALLNFLGLAWHVEQTDLVAPVALTFVSAWWY